MTRRRALRRFASVTEIIPAAASWHSLRGQVGGVSFDGRLTPTVLSHTWHRSRSIHPLSQVALFGLCDTSTPYSEGSPDLAQPSQLLSRLDKDFVTRDVATPDPKGSGR